KADIRGDIYSLGCTLFHLLTGRPPFVGGSLPQKVAWHLQAKPPSISSVRPGLPAPLEALVCRMMAKKLEERPQTPAEVAAALAAFCQRQPVASPPTMAPAPPM